MPRKAIILRGAPGSGKTTVAKTLRDHLGLAQSSHVSLDDGWCPGEQRYSGIGRYDDLRGHSDYLLIELGYGEPLGEGFEGATKNPAEWVAVLEDDERQPFFFLLDVGKDECLRRVAARGNMNRQYAEAAWLRYAQGRVCSSSAFTSRLGSEYAERGLDTEVKDLETVVADILETVLPAQNPSS